MKSNNERSSWLNSQPIGGCYKPTPANIKLKQVDRYYSSYSTYNFDKHFKKIIKVSLIDVSSISGLKVLHGCETQSLYHLTMGHH